MLAVVRQHGSSAGVSERQHVLVCHIQTRQVRLGDRQYVVAELPQYPDSRSRKAFIRKEEGQSLGLLILSDLTVNFVLVISDKRPGVYQIGCPEYGERGQNLSFGQTKPPIALERPN